MTIKARYFSGTTKTRRVAPGDLPGSIGVLGSLDDPMPIGIAFDAGHIGGWHGGVDLGPSETIWRLQVGSNDLDGRWALRDGEFIGLAEDAE